MKIACLYFNKNVALTEIAQACLRFSPKVSAVFPNIIYIDISNCEKLYSDSRFLLSVQVLLKKFNTQAYTSLSYSPSSALALSRYFVKNLENLPIESLQEFYDPYLLKKETQNIEKIVESLKKLGIHTLTQFCKLPQNQLPSRFGKIGLYCLQIVKNEIQIPWKHWEPPAQYLEKKEFLDSDFCGNLEPLLFNAKELLDRLFSRLRGQKLRAEKIEVILNLEKFSSIQRPIRKWVFEFISPQGSTLGFLPILRERLQRDFDKDPIESPIISFSFEATQVAPSRERQKVFFGDTQEAQEENHERMAIFFAQIEELLGTGNVFWAKINENRFPEKSWERVKTFETKHADILNQYPLRPTRLLKNPKPIFVSQTKLFLNQSTHSLKKWSNIERISMDWLNSTPARNYYKVDLEDGPSLWIFSQNEAFFIHGYFE